MYVAELKGKLSSSIRNMEDILTSNVFSFFKYANRKVFLKNYLLELGIRVDDKQSGEAEFYFWPTYEDYTEPDLVIIIGDYYLLIEAKYRSSFGRATESKQNQLIRELREGQLEAKNLDKKFILVAITADYYYKRSKFNKLLATIDNKSSFVWTNWQEVAKFLNKTLESNLQLTSHERAFATDLYNLLVEKNLRKYIGIDTFDNISLNFKRYSQVFFVANTATFRGGFIGFQECFANKSFHYSMSKNLFFRNEKRFFLNLGQIEKITCDTNTSIFLKGVKSNE